MVSQQAGGVALGADLVTVDRLDGELLGVLVAPDALKKWVGVSSVRRSDKN